MMVGKQLAVVGNHSAHGLLPHYKLLPQHIHSSTTPVDSIKANVDIGHSPIVHDCLVVFKLLLFWCFLDNFIFSHICKFLLALRVSRY